MKQIQKQKKSSGVKHLRKAAGKIWNDPTLADWPANDFRIFCGDLGNEVTDELLSNAFRHLHSFQKAKVIRDSRTGKTRGFGFVSFAKPDDMLTALKTMNRKYVGNRPIRVMRSDWKVREINSDKNRAEAGKMQIAELTAKRTLKKFKTKKQSQHCVCLCVRVFCVCVCISVCMCVCVCLHIIHCVFV